MFLSFRLFISKGTFHFLLRFFHQDLFDIWRKNNFSDILKLHVTDTCLPFILYANIKTFNFKRIHCQLLAAVTSFKWFKVISVSNSKFILCNCLQQNIVYSYDFFSITKRKFKKKTNYFFHRLNYIWKVVDQLESSWLKYFPFGRHKKAKQVSSLLWISWQKRKLKTEYRVILI